MAAFEVAEWREFINQLVLALPGDCRRLTIYNLSFVFLVIKSRLTFAYNVDTDTTEYGQLDDRTYTISVFEEIQTWIMDPSKCFTNWEKVLQIRKQNPSFVAGEHSTAAGNSAAASSSQSDE